MKIYCNNCKFMGPFEIADCRAPENNQSVDYWAFRQKRQVIKPPYELNANNDCKLYKRIWWMWWVK